MMKLELWEKRELQVEEILWTCPDNKAATTESERREGAEQTPPAAV